MLGSYDPFFRLTGRAVYRPNDDWILQAGLAWRQLEDETDERTFNHTYLSYNVNATRVGLAEGKLDVTLSGVGYSSTQTNDTFVLNANAIYRLTQAVGLSGGVDYSLYKYVYFNNSEREDVWTFWIRARWQARKDLRIVGGISVDDTRFTTYTTVYVRATWRF